MSKQEKTCECGAWHTTEGKKHCPIREKTFEERFDKEVPIRTLAEDNPQYGLGWNAARHISESFFRIILKSEIKAILEEIEKEGEFVNIERMDSVEWNDGYERRGDQMKAKLTELKKRYGIE